MDEWDPMSLIAGVEEAKESHELNVEVTVGR
jgi:hypothetical protein